MHYLPDKKIGHSHVTESEADWLAGIIVNQNLNKKFRSSYQNVQSEASELLYLCNQHWTSLTLFKCSALSTDTKTQWNLHVGASSVNANYQITSIPLSNFYRSELHHGAAFFTGSAQLSLVCHSIDKTWNITHVQN